MPSQCSPTGRSLQSDQTTSAISDNKAKGSLKKQNYRSGDRQKHEIQPLLGSLKSDEHRSSTTSSSPVPSPLKDEKLGTNKWSQVEHTENDEGSKESKLCLIFHCLMFCGMTTSSDIMWTFTRKVVDSGGVYFILIYILMLLLVAFPLLHMEIFVGQRCQSGIVRTMRMYGQGFEFIGIAFFCFALIRSLADGQKSYVLIRHLINLIFDFDGIMSCESYKEVKQFHACISRLDDSKCNGTTYYGGNCVNKTTNPLTDAVHVSQLYIERMRRTNASDFDSERLVYNGLFGGLIAVVGICGFLGVCAFLAITYCCFFVTFVIVYFPHRRFITKFWQMGDKLSVFSSFDAMFSLVTYMSALQLCVVTTGIGFSGILCASSFRPKRGNSFVIAHVIIISNIILCLVNLINYLCNDETRTPSMEGAELLMGKITEQAIEEVRYRTWIKAITFGAIMINLNAFCGPLIMLLAIVRDHVHRHRNLWNIAAAVGLSLICFMLNTIRSLPSVNERYSLFIYDMDFSVVYLAMALLVVIFIHLYGKREYIIDLCELYQLKEKQNPITSATHTWQFTVFDIVPFAFLLVQIHMVADVSHFFNRNDSLSEIARCFFVILITSIMLCFFIRFVYVYTHYSNWLSVLLTVNPEHPSYKRITSECDTTKKE